MRLRVAFLGYGYWGKNVLRALLREPRVEVSWASDPSLERARQLKADYPDLRVTADFWDALADPAVDAVVCATPAETHASLALVALQAGKHVYVEKPLATSRQDAEELVEVVEASGRVLQVGHIFEYADPVRRLQSWILDQRLGRLRYLTANRSSLGPRLRTDVNVVWDYAIHDLYLLNLLLGSSPDRVAARGIRGFYPDIDDTVFIQLWFPGDVVATVHATWHAPTKRRELTVVGTDAMAVYDDVAADKLLLYQRGFRRQEGPDDWGNVDWQLFDDGVTRAELDPTPPLDVELSHFVDCIERQTTPISDVYDGLQTVRVLDAVDRSLRRDGEEVSLNYERAICGPARTVPRAEVRDRPRGARGSR